MQEKVLMKGNEAIAEAAILAGCRHYFGYPITPQTEVAAYMAKRMPKIGGTSSRPRARSPPSIWSTASPPPASAP
jgi:pyruvate/2-oxoacid:ferredoxin oxidoreductase alpha subunit